MKCKHLKLIMELIFIFILPLLFILPCIKIKDNYVYDNNGNYQVSEKVVEFVSPLNLTTNIVESVNVYGNVVFSPDTYYELSFSHDGFFDIDFDNDFYLVESNEYFDLCDENLNSLFSFYFYLDGSTITLDVKYRFSNDNTIYYDSVNYLVPEDGFADGWKTYLYSDISTHENYYCFTWYVVNYFLTYIQAFSLNDFVGGWSSVKYLYVNDVNELLNPNGVIDSYDVITVNEEINLFGKIKQLILNTFDIDSNIVVDLVLTYTFLWLIMFILWHFIYCVFDFIVHLVDKQRRRE